MMSIHAHRPPYQPLSQVSHPHHKEPAHYVPPAPTSVAQVNNTMVPPLGTLATLRQEMAKGFATEVGKSVLGAGVLAGSAAAFHSVDRRFFNNAFFKLFREVKQRKSVIKKTAEFKGFLAAGLLIKAFEKGTDSAIDVVNHVVKQKFPSPVVKV